MIRRSPISSAAEVAACLQVAEAFGYLSPVAIEPSLGIADRSLRLLRGLTR